MPSMERLHQKLAGTRLPHRRGERRRDAFDTPSGRPIQNHGVVNQMGLHFDICTIPAADPHRYQTTGVPESFVIDREA